MRRGSNEKALDGVAVTSPLMFKILTGLVRQGGWGRADLTSLTHHAKANGQNLKKDKNRFPTMFPK